MAFRFSFLRVGKKLNLLSFPFSNHICFIVIVMLSIFSLALLLTASAGAVQTRFTSKLLKLLNISRGIALAHC